NVNSKTPIKDTFVHELTHFTEASGLYNDFASAVLDSDKLHNEISEMGLSLNEYKDKIRTEYAQNGKELDERGIEREIVAKFAENFLKDERTITRLAETDKGLFSHIQSWIKDLLVRFKGTAEEKSLLKISKLYEKAFKDAKGKTAASGAQDSVHTDADGKPFVVIDKDILQGVPKSEWVATVKNVFKEKYPNGIDMGYFNIAVNAKTRNELLNSEYSKALHKSNNLKYRDKMRMVDNLDEIVQNAYNVENESLKHSREDGLKSFNRGSIDVRIGSKDYSIEVVTGITAQNEERFYDVLKIVQKKVGTDLSAYPQKNAVSTDEVNLY
ncbi:MAG: hypothetical protein RR576_01130, partial [Oscillospiraceae bacterium]